MTRASIFLASLIVLFLAGCAGHNAPPLDSVDPDTVQSPTPKKEPLSKIGNPQSYEVFGKTYYPVREAHGFTQIGQASWYGPKFHGRQTSNGEVYDMFDMTAAHKTLPLPSFVRVTNLENDKEVIVRVNDRGPFHDNRIIDLSYMAAQKLGFADHGTAPVKVEAITFDNEGNTNDAAQTEQESVEKQPAIAQGPYLQAGVFSNQTNAQRLADKISRLDIDPVSVKPLESNGSTLHQVRIGPFANDEQLRTIRHQLVSEHIDVVTKNN